MKGRGQWKREDEKGRCRAHCVGRENLTGGAIFERGLGGGGGGACEEVGMRVAGEGGASWGGTGLGGGSEGWGLR